MEGTSVTAFFGTDFMPLKQQKQNLNTSRRHARGSLWRFRVSYKPQPLQSLTQFESTKLSSNISHRATLWLFKI